MCYGHRARYPDLVMPLRPALAVALTILFWGSSFTGIRVALDSFSPGPLALLRFTTASIVLLTAAVISPVPFPKREDWPRTAGLALIGITIYHLCLNFGQQTVPPGTTALLIQTAPVFTAVFAHVAGIERLRWDMVLGISIAFAGTLLLIVGQGRTIEFTLAAGAILMSAIGTATYFLFQRPLAARYGVRSVTTWTIVFGTLPMVYFAPLAAAEWQTATWTAIQAIVFIGVFPAAIAYLLWNYAVHELGASRTMMFLYGSPIVTLFTAWLWFGTTPPPISLVGGGITIAGVWWLNRSRARAAAAAATANR
jgi:drug/metabolite transporter (DMT)-like permease